MNKHHVITVEYLNTRPFLEGLRRSSVQEQIVLEIAHPALCAQKIQSPVGEIGLIPVGALPDLPNYEIISDYCLGCDGPVSSVCVFSDRPLEECRRLILDYQSRTSVTLVKYLQEKFWHYDLEFIQGQEGYEKSIQGDTAGLVIGDRCFNLKSKFPHILDLGKIWKEKTNLPFVFAVWITRKKLPDEFKTAFNQALKAGVEHLEWAASSESSDFQYLSHHISYPFDARKKEAFRMFMHYLQEEMVGIT